MSSEIKHKKKPLRTHYVVLSIAGGAYGDGFKLCAEVVPFITYKHMLVDTHT